MQAEGIWQLRWLRVASLWGGQPIQNRWRQVEEAGPHGGIRCDEQGSCEARFNVCWIDYLLRVHAGYGNGQRARCGVLPL
jgi:hypothetical protein